MYVLRRFHGADSERLNAIVDSMAGHVSTYVSLVGSASLPLPEVCQMEGMPGTACRVEGHLHERYFPGTDPIDQAEALIEEGVRDLFGLDRSYAVTGQPHSATQANHAVFLAVLGDSGAPLAALAPANGGHISHQLGRPRASEFVDFPLSKGLIDYDELDRVVRRTRPGLLVAGGTTYSRAIDYERLAALAAGVGAHLHADLAHTAPFVAAGLHPPVFPHCDSVTLDTSKNLRGPRGGILIYREERADEMKRAIFPLLQSSPNQNGLLAKAAWALRWSKADLRSYAKSMVGHATVLAQELEASLGAPVFGGTDTHLLTFDVTPLGGDGLEAEEALASARILVNRNQVPGDLRGPRAPSGIRLGSTVLAILNYEKDDTCSLGSTVAAVLRGKGDTDGVVPHLLEKYHSPLVSIASE